MVRRRGAQYWFWTNSRLALHSHEEVLSDGLQIEVQARINTSGVTQVFVGVYLPDGRAGSEEFHDLETQESCELALKWGTWRSREIFFDHHGFTAPHRVQGVLCTVASDSLLLVPCRMDWSDTDRRKLAAADEISRASGRSIR